MRRSFFMGVAAVSLCAAMVIWAGGDAQDEAKVAVKDGRGSAEEAKCAKWEPAIKPKALSENVNRGLAWLVKTQHENGGWGQGEESSQMGTAQQHLKDTPNMADTCVATLALIRAGSTPSEGPHSKNILSALGFLCSEVEKSDEKSLFVTSIRGTRVQMKLGTYIDTFLTAMLLAEVRDKMPDEAWKKRVFAALDKVMDKIEKNQKQDGTWANEGWAPALAQSMASKALNRAAQAGAEVSEQVREKAETYAGDQFTEHGGKVAAKPTGSAGVALYAFSSSLGALQDSANTNAELGEEVGRKLREAKTEDEREEAKATLERFKKNEEKLDAARAEVVRKLDDKQFIAGFGSNGGEEFLSYMNIGESLVVKGGEAWEKWDKSITNNLNHIQNQDGSWTGHHCITGRTFCTSAALLVLTVDRAPVPLAAKIGRR